MKLVPSAVTRSIARRGLLAQRNAPTVLFGLGVAGSVASTVLACRATLRLHEVVNEAQEDLGKARQLVHYQSQRETPEYTEQDHKQDTAIIYARSVGKVARLYAPSILLGAASVACLTKSHNILQERNLALTAAYAAVDEAFKKYRQRVADKYGEEEARNLRYDTETVREYDEGENKHIEKEVLARDNEHSMYARFFDQLSPNWSKEPEYNLLFLRSQQNYFNDLLRARGHLFLNEVYEGLGLTHTRAGAVVGWVISDDGDNFVDFGVYEPHNEKARDFVNGREGSILLDFNVDGVIWDKIKDPGERVRWQS